MADKKPDPAAADAEAKAKAEADKARAKKLEPKDNVRVKHTFVGRFEQGNVVPAAAYGLSECARLVDMDALEFTDDEPTVEFHPSESPVPDIVQAAQLQKELADAKAELAKLKGEGEPKKHK